MNDPKPLTLDDFSDKALVVALKLCPDQLKAAVVGVATQIELQERRSKD